MVRPSHICAQPLTVCGTLVSRDSHNGLIPAGKGSVITLLPIHLGKLRLGGGKG